MGSLFTLSLVVVCSLPMLSGVAFGATVSAGGLAIISYRDNGEASAESDGFVMLATETIAAGTVVYATNNGWSNASYGQFAGAGTADGQGAGVEQLVRVTFNSTVYAGSTISTEDLSNGDFTWETSASIPGIGFSEFAPLQFKHPGQPGGTFASSDQIYLFQASGSNPLLNVQNFIYLLDFGDLDTPGFEDYQGVNDEGALPNGFVSLDEGLSYYNVPTVRQGSDGDPLTTNDFTAVELIPSAGLHQGTFGLNLSNPTIAALQSAGGTKEQWLAAIAQTVNWDDGLPAMLIGGFNVLAVPEPQRLLLLGLALVAGLAQRRRCGVL
jgi:hypothetical protein